MKKFFLLIAVHIVFLNAVYSAGSFAKWTKSELTPDNGIVQRIIKLPAENGNLVNFSNAVVEIDGQTVKGKGFLIH